MVLGTASLTRSPKGRIVLGLMLGLMLGLALLAPNSAFAGPKKKTPAAPKKVPVIDYSNIVWPNPPAIEKSKLPTILFSPWMPTRMAFWRAIRITLSTADGTGRFRG